jgi:hypothetical protein
MLIYEVSVPYNPQTNGVAERAFGTLIPDVRAMLNGSNMSPRWWGWALKSAGCPVAYLRQVPRDTTGKFGPRALRGRLIGYGLSGIYENGQMRCALGYVIATADNTVTVSRHILFDESALFNSIDLEERAQPDR